MFRLSGAWEYDSHGQMKKYILKLYYNDFNNTKNLNKIALSLGINDKVLEDKIGEYGGRIELIGINKQAIFKDRNKLGDFIKYFEPQILNINSAGRK